MKKVLCMEDGTEYFFCASSGFDALQKMLYTLNLSKTDKNAHIDLCNRRTWTITHDGKVYACTI